MRIDNMLEDPNQFDPLSFLQEFRNTCIAYYPSCGNDLRGLWMLPVSLVILSDNLFGYTGSAEEFLEGFQTGAPQAKHWFFPAAGTAVWKIEFEEARLDESLFPPIHNPDHEHRRMLSPTLWAIPFMEDNLKTLERIRQAELKICLFIGKNDGCRLGGNRVCVNEMPFFIRLIPVLGEEWLYVTDHGPVTRRREDIQPRVEQHFGPLRPFVEQLMAQLGMTGTEHALSEGMRRLGDLDPETLTRLLEKFYGQYGPLLAPLLLEAVPFEEWEKWLRHLGWADVEKWEGSGGPVFLRPFYANVLTWCRVIRRT